MSNTKLLIVEDEVTQIKSGELFGKHYNLETTIAETLEAALEVLGSIYEGEGDVIIALDGQFPSEATGMGDFGPTVLTSGLIDPEISFLIPNSGVEKLNQKMCRIWTENLNADVSRILSQEGKPDGFKTGLKNYKDTYL